MSFLLIFLLYGLVLSVALATRTLPPRRHVSREPMATPVRRVLVVGATGGTGRQLVSQALERGYHVTAFVRDPAKLGVEHERLSVATGDVLDYAAVDAAVADHDAVVCALGHKRFYSLSWTLSRGTSNLVRAMETRGVRRMVCATSLGIGASAGRMGLYYTFFVIPAILPLYFWDKTRQERVVAASILDWVIVRPATLTNGEKRGAVRHGGGIGSLLWTVRISRADVAAFMLDQLEDDTYLGLAPGVR